MARRRTVAAAIGLSVLSAAPQFLLGSLYPLMHRDLGVSLATSGAAVAASYGTAALSSLWSGRLVERLGVTRSAQLCTVVLAVSLGAVAFVGEPVPWLLLVAALAGVALAISQPVSNAMLADVVDKSRHGLVFGLKQAATPAAILFAGVVVPVAESSVGWRPVFASAAAASLALGALLGGRRGGRRDTGAQVRELASARAPVRLGVLTVMAAAALFAAAASISTSVFLVQFSSTKHLSVVAGGLVLAAASCAAIGARIGVGWLADRWRLDALRAMAAMTAAGTVALIALALAPVPVAFVAAALAVGATAWAWNGLFHLAVVTAEPAAAARATAVTQVGMQLGAGAGPLVIGAIAGSLGPSGAWLVAAALMAQAMWISLVADRMLRSPRVVPAVI